MAAHTSTPIIPAPARLRPAVGEFRLLPGTTIVYRDPILAPLARRFAQDATRRCRIALDVGPGERAPAITIDLGEDPGLQALPAPPGPRATSATRSPSTGPGSGCGPRSRPAWPAP
jgi:hypothetical protein